MRPLLISLCLAALLCYAPILQAQDTIRVKVRDKSGNAIPFAGLLLQSLPDSTLMKTDIADSAGNISISIGHLPALIAVSSTGFVTNYQLINWGSSTDIDIILTESGRSLAGVTISAAKPLIERKSDRIVFNVEHSISAIGGDAFEALQKAPGVRASESAISIIGKSTVSIMLNDRLLRVGAEELEALLRSIPADNLARIEVITTPPARYDAEGNAGIINIVTKKSKQAGLNGSITGRYLQRIRPSHLVNGQFNLREGALNVFGGSAVRKLRLTTFQNTTTTYSIQRQEQELNQFHDPLWGRHELGADYQITKEATIGMQYTLATGHTWLEQFYNNRVLQIPSNHLDSISRTYALGGEKGRRHILNINYEWSIDSTGKKLNIDVDLFNREGTKKRDFMIQNYLADGSAAGLTADNRTSGKQKVNISAIKADVTFPTSFADYTFGAKISAINNLSDNLFVVKQGNAYISDTNRSNLFEYREQIQALYFSSEKQLGKWEVQVGLRCEYTQMAAKSVTLNQTIDSSYFKLFPTAYLQYNSSDKHQWNLNYSRRIERPDPEDLNPFRTYTTNNSYYAGNPFLQPSFAHNLELSYIYKSRFVFTGYVSSEEGLFVPVIRTDASNNYFYLIDDNVGNSTSYGLSASLTFQPRRWWESNIQADGYYQKLYTYYSASMMDYKQPSWSAQTINNFTLNKSKTLLAELGFEYYSDMIEDVDIRNSYCNLEAGVKALLFEKQLTIALNGYDILQTQTYEMRNLYNGARRNQNMDWQQLAIAVTWNFGNKCLKAKRRRNSSSEEMNRAQ